MHYHIYFGPKSDSIPKDIFNFNNSESAIDKVCQLLESLGVKSDGTVDMSHLENSLGKFSIIIVPDIQYKIVLHECDNNCGKLQKLDLTPKTLN